jgi:Zn finger protein HypA/HybF involved in hydrogenase expression
MKCYECGHEASVAVREQAMLMTLETTRFYCRDCYDNKRKNSPPKNGPSPEEVKIICPKCGTKNLRTDNRCRECETDLAEVKKRLIHITRS